MFTAPFALVVGDVSLVRALGRMHVPVVVATDDPLAPAARSRFCRGVVRIPSFVDDPDAAIATIATWAASQAAPPVVFYQGDPELLALSRRRDRITPYAHLVLPPAELVEDLVDKLRFAALADKLELPVPRTLVVRRDGTADELAAWDAFPCVVKPAFRAGRWDNDAKAMRIDDRTALDAAVADALATGDCVVQAAVEGGEERVLSYHAYVRKDGSIAAEFTGKKLRTRPVRYGFSTCVTVAHEPEVLFRGRDIVDALGFTGVLKIDFKRDERDEQLYLLEINPRFNLWHHPGTVAGVAIPALVYEDCIHPAAGTYTLRPRKDVVWMNMRGDVHAALEHMRDGRLSLSGWLKELVRADVHEDLCLVDPVPALFDLASRARGFLSDLVLGDAP